MSNRAQHVGIDLGTTNSAAAVFDGETVSLVRNAQGATLTPSVVRIDARGGVTVGARARRFLESDPQNTRGEFKRLMGTAQAIEFAAIKASKRPEELAAEVLKSLRADVKEHLGFVPARAVISVPALFELPQSAATSEAARLAGFEKVELIQEPVASALAAGWSADESSGSWLVYDLGGGTFDVSILELGEGVFEVKSTNGDTHLGGDDFDRRVMQWLVDEFKKDSGIDLSKDRMALQRLKDAAEKAKIELSNTLQAEINLPFITADASGPKHLQKTLSRANFESLIGDLLENSKVPCNKALADAGLTAAQIDEVILVGGSTRIPKVQQIVRELFGKEPSKGVNPDEAVAVGAAIQGGILGGEVKDVLLLDVTPLSLGIETLGQVMTKLIQRNTTIPCRKSQIFSTAADGQNAVSIHVLQGEREMATQNRTLGRFDLVGIPAAPRGIPQIEVTFDIDANGIVHVTAKDLGTGKEQKIRIEAASGLNESQIDQMVKDAEAHAEEDKRERERAEVRNEADSLMYSTEKSLKEFGDKVSATDKAAIEAATAELKKALEGQDIELIKGKTEALKQASYKLAEEIYKASAAQQPGAQAGGDPGASGGAGSAGPGAGPGASGTADDVDYRVVDEEEKK